MTDLSPMERAVRALGHELGRRCAANAAVLPWAEGWKWVNQYAETIAAYLLDDLATVLRTSDPEAFAAVLAECGGGMLADHDHALAEPCTPSCPADAGVFVREGQAVVGGRVVELEPKTRWHSDPGRCNHHEHDGFCRNTGGDWTQLYRVKPERSDQQGDKPTLMEALGAAVDEARTERKRSDRHTEPTCPSCGAPIEDHDSAQRKPCHDAASGFDRGRKQHTEGEGS